MVSAHARNLIRRASVIYDAPESPLPLAVRLAWKGGFASGGRWMQLAFVQLRGQAVPDTGKNLNLLGAIKYGLCVLAALLVAGIAIWVDSWAMFLCCILAFYAVEAQMVFLFPIAIDGSPTPFRDSRLWTVQAGGTLWVMWVVVPIACLMLFGGFVGQRFTRSWGLGCLAICIWYEDLRTARQSAMAESPSIMGKA